MNFKKVYITLLLTLFSISLIHAQQNEQDELAQKLQNPLASIIALPIQQNIGLNKPGHEGASYTMSFQPIIGTEFEKFNLVHRAVWGMSHLPSSTEGRGSQFGVTDLNYSFFFSPKKKLGNLAWGIGPSIDIPTASHSAMGTEKWSAGASAVFVYQTKRWTFDMIFRQTASFAGNSDRHDVNAFVGQTLIAYGLGKGWVVNTFPTITANWNAESGEKWTVPVGGGINKLVFLGGKLPLNLGLQYYHNVVKPNHAANGELRFQTTFVFAK
ncbi:neuromedin U [Sediminitomix flava]|uniref:Outer membrane beta-barrel porin/alpha-amylase n=1 Tax=Sediminitomix flava TaxID=379075 RepID=A0A315Z914_SEDFL|nr:neuromedin U [Sediminitomix flava]PWJ41782.1 hypothetical protein BC781_10332 [Sediminitomix flava]